MSGTVRVAGSNDRLAWPWRDGDIVSSVPLASLAALAGGGSALERMLAAARCSRPELAKLTRPGNQRRRFYALRLYGLALCELGPGAMQLVSVEGAGERAISVAIQRAMPALRAWRLTREDEALSRARVAFRDALLSRKEEGNKR